MKGYRIKLIRHGMTDANLKGIYAGKSDFPLCERGQEELIKKKVAGIYTPVQRLYVSPMKRCVMTADILYPAEIPVAVEDLREMDFGEFEGKTAQELMELPEYKAFLKGGANNAPPGGESMASVVQRIFNGICLVIQDMMNNGFTSAAVITHGGIIMDLLSCFGLPKLPPMEYPCDFGEGYEIMVTADMWMRSNAFEILGRFPREEEDEEF